MSENIKNEASENKQSRRDRKQTNLFIVEGMSVVTFAAIMAVMYILDASIYTYDPVAEAWGWSGSVERASLTFLGRCIVTFPIWLALDVGFHGYDLLIKKTQVEQNHRLVNLTTKLAFFAAMAMFTFTFFLAMF